MDQRLDRHRERASDRIGAIRAGGIHIAQIREIGDQCVGAERRVAAIEEVLELNNAIAGAAGFRVKRAAGRGKIRIGIIDFQVAGGRRQTGGVQVDKRFSCCAERRFTGADGNIDLPVRADRAVVENNAWISKLVVRVTVGDGDSGRAIGQPQLRRRERRRGECRYGC